MRYTEVSLSQQVNRRAPTGQARRGVVVLWAVMPGGVDCRGAVGMKNPPT